MGRHKPHNNDYAGSRLHEDYPIHCYYERYEIIATPINSNRLTDFDLKKSKRLFYSISFLIFMGL